MPLPVLFSDERRHKRRKTVRPVNRQGMKGSIRERGGYHFSFPYLRLAPRIPYSFHIMSGAVTGHVRNRENAPLINE